MKGRRKDLLGHQDWLMDPTLLRICRPLKKKVEYWHVQQCVEHKTQTLQVEKKSKNHFFIYNCTSDIGIISLMDKYCTSYLEPLNLLSSSYFHYGTVHNFSAVILLILPLHPKFTTSIGIIHTVFQLIKMFFILSASIN